jgi:quercetin dioxygenase-like cupin family protein
MDKDAFRADLLREGYEIKEGELPANEHNEMHAHEFDARALVVGGSFTLVFGDGTRRTYRPGDSFFVAAGTMHEEFVSADGFQYLAGLRQVTEAHAAE